MKKNFAKAVVCVCTLSLGVGVFTPLASAKELENVSYTDQNVSVAEPTFQLSGELRHSLTSNPLYAKYESRTTSADQLQAQGIFGATLKGIKIVGWICRSGGKGLKALIRPLSPDKARLVDKYAREIAYACETVTEATKGALVSALEATGVEGKAAESLAEIILWII